MKLLHFVWCFILSFSSICYCLIPSHHHSPETNRREALSIVKTMLISPALCSSFSGAAQAALPKEPNGALEKNYITSKTWEGTSLNLLLPSDAVSYLNDKGSNVFPMGRWPDPILRIPSIPTPSSLFGTSTLKTVADALRETSRLNGAVGLAAQQCGVQMSMIFLDVTQNQFSYNTIGNTNKNGSGMFFVNPRFIKRSPESQMKVWTEECLVLPPDFHATVLRDAKIAVEAEDLDGNTFRVQLTGEDARAIQHECDHDRGILITDHVGIEEMRDDTMWMIEKEGHYQRQEKAYDRYLGTPSSSLANNYNYFAMSSHWDEESSYAAQVKKWIVPSANAEEIEPKTLCDEACKKRIEEKRALLKQSRSTRSRQEIFELSRQRAALYNTTYKGSSCVDSVPCY